MEIEMVSNCCGAPVPDWDECGLCPDCKEHCDEESTLRATLVLLYGERIEGALYPNEDTATGFVFVEDSQAAAVWYVQQFTNTSSPEHYSDIFLVMGGPAKIVGHLIIDDETQQQLLNEV